MKASFPKDLTGMSFGRLTVIELYEIAKFGQRWLCKCECGNKKVIYRTNLIGGMSTSCGCYQREITSTHGLSKHPLYSIWCDMKKRCYNKHSEAYKNYGGRGIKICEQWLDFQNFYDWSIANGYSHVLTIDRIDNDMDYSPDNCRWTSRLIQNNNTRKNVFIEIDGEIHTIAEWARKCGLNEATIRYRIYRGHKGKELIAKTLIKRKG